MAFWRRKKDEFVSLGLNQPSTAPAPESGAKPTMAAEPQKPLETPPPRTVETPQPSPSAPWQTSVLGLDLSIEQLQAREAALEQEFSARFRRAVAATRSSSALTSAANTLAARPEMHPAIRPAVVDTVPMPSANASRSLTRALGLKINRVVIDAGHGGHDYGTIGPHGVLEKLSRKQPRSATGCCK